MTFGPSATRAANSGPVARSSEVDEFPLLPLTHASFQALYLVSKSCARAGDAVLSLLYRSSADFTAAAPGGGTGAKRSMSEQLRLGRALSALVVTRILATHSLRYTGSRSRTTYELLEEGTVDTGLRMKANRVLDGAWCAFKNVTRGQLPRAVPPPCVFGV